MALYFTWDPAKADANVAKHGVAFEEAATVFVDPLARIDFDAEHADHEERWLMTGWSARRRPLTVWYTEHEDTIRIIGCRKATRAEQHDYANRPWP